VSCNRTLPNLIFGLPLSLSFDNLLGGAGISALGYPMVPAALLIGLVSAAMSCAGLYLGGWLRRFVQRGFVAWCLEPAVGAYLCLLAVRLLVANRS
jgi:putative Mn2+ efflux pump MntP